jgi:triacylglycerol esterase/lipase EstA (alpha/beta hydrolase family)
MKTETSELTFKRKKTAKKAIKDRRYKQMVVRFETGDLIEEVHEQTGIKKIDLIHTMIEYAYNHITFEEEN